MTGQEEFKRIRIPHPASRIPWFHTRLDTSHTPVAEEIAPPSMSRLGWTEHYATDDPVMRTYPIAMDMKLSDVPSVRVGHATDKEGLTGCTVILGPDEGFVAGVDVRGSAAGTRSLDALKPTSRIDKVHAILLCGGSGFGLGAVDGVLKYLVGHSIGIDRGVAVVPVVPAAVIFDLGIGSSTAWPSPEHGYAACVAAEAHSPVEEGGVGVGTGATVGKLRGMKFAMKGGVGSAGLRLPSGGIVAALAVTNAYGDVYDDTGRVVAGARSDHGVYVNTCRALLSDRAAESAGDEQPLGGNTTLVVIATDVRLSKSECQKLAELGQDGLAIAIRPVHTLYDGDTVFAVSVGDLVEDPVVVGVAAVEVVKAAIVRSVRLVA